MRRSELDNAKGVETPEIVISADIEIIPNSGEISTVTLEPDLSLQIAPIADTVAPTSRRRLLDHFGPEVTAGIVIAVLFVVFAGLMMLGIGDEPVSKMRPTPVAPLAEVPVEIGEGITLERE